MYNYQTFHLPENFSFKLCVSPVKIELSDATHQAIEEVWQEAQEQHAGRLFDGKVLSLISSAEHGLLAGFVDYKRFLAYLRKPSLRKVLGIKPLSLSCITHTDQAILVGRRSEKVSQYPLWYELAPSGGIDAEAARGECIDIVDQALRELTEETGLDRADVLSVRPFALVTDVFTGMAEVCVDISLIPGRDRLPLSATPEYATLQWVDYVDLPQFLQTHMSRIVPLSLHLLKLPKVRN